MVAYNIISDFGAVGNDSTDDAPAFATFNKTARLIVGDTVTLTLPSNKTFFFGSNAVDGTGSSFRWAAGIPSLIVEGTGATVTNHGSNSIFFQLGAASEDTTFVPYTRTAFAGDHSVYLIDPTQSSLFTVGQYACMTGFEMQPFGYPTHHHFFDYVRITAIASITGKISFDRGLTDNYYSTWPDYGLSAGGPAVLYPMTTDWNADVEFRGLTIAQTGVGTVTAVRHAKFSNIVSTGPLGISPTVNELFEVYNSDMSSNNVEVDQLITTLKFENTPINILRFQTSSVKKLIQNNSPILNTLDGTPRVCEVTNSSLAVLKIGAISAGRTDEVKFTDCAITSLIPQGGGDDGVAKGVNNAYQMSAGIIKVPKSQSISNAVNNGSGLIRITVPSTAGYITGQYGQVLNLVETTEGNGTWAVTVHSATELDLQGTSFVHAYVTTGGSISNGNNGAVRWAVPGTWCYWTGTYQNEGSFQVKAVTEDAVNTYVATNLAGGFPSLPVDAPGLIIKVHPAPLSTFVNNTIDPTAIDLTQAQPHHPLFEYTNRVYTGNTLRPGNVIPPSPYVWGTIVSLKVNVSQAYTGTQSTLTLQLDWPTIKADETAFRYTPIFDLKTAGLRTITGTSTTGTAGIDSALNLPEAVWFTGQGFAGPNANHDVSAEAANKWPIVSIEIVTNQNITTTFVPSWRFGAHS